jgi:tRNA pseudouridine32 synthase/23S rRNA pseudouridine746 synthase
MTRHQLFAVVLGLSTVNGMFSPYLGFVLQLSPLWMPNWMPGSPGVLFYVSSMLTATTTLLASGIPAAIAESEPRVVFEDEFLVVVDKPSGLLSVPGRSGLLRDSVSTRLRARYPDASGQLVVHRLDLDTSGLMLAAKHTATFSALQRLFSLREIRKRYVAWLDGEVSGNEGLIDFPMRMDIDDRPRHIHDPVHGKHAVTGWQVLERAGGRTKVAFTPHTGRTHQLRVHASNPLGLDAPIVGDRLYGRTAPEHGERLLLHAESLAFTHPETGAELILTSPVPF